MATLIKQANHYYLQFYDNSKTPNRKRVALKTTKKNIALKLKVRLEDEYALGNYDPWLEAVSFHEEEPPKITTVNEALQTFLSYKTKEDWRTHTAESNTYILNRFLDFIGNNLPLRDLTHDKINAFINRDNLAYESKKSYLKRLNTFVNWLNREELLNLKVSTLKIYNRDDEQSEGINYLSPTEIDKIIQTISDQVTKDIKLGFQTKEKNSLWLIDLINWQRYSGMRIGETLNLRVEDINIDTWEIHIGSKTFSTKTKQKNVLPIKDVKPLIRIAQKYLKLRDDPSDRLFGRKDKSRTSKQFKKYLRIALPDRDEIKLHSLRHTCCIELLRAGVPIYTVQRWMRHKSIRTTQRYADLLNMDISEAIGRAFDNVE